MSRLDWPHHHVPCVIPSATLARLLRPDSTLDRLNARRRARRPAFVAWVSRTLAWMLGR